jgi:hypothetical protein
MTDADLRLVIRSKITDGMLPRDKVGLVSATYGSHQACDACSASISPLQVMYRLTRTGCEGFVFHSECFAVWRSERNSVLAEELEVLGNVCHLPTSKIQLAKH